MSWLARLKNSNVPPLGTAITDKSPSRPLLAVLSVPHPATFEKHEPAKTGRVVARFRLPGDPPSASATCIGRPGASVESVIAELRERWPGVQVLDARQ